MFRDLHVCRKKACFGVLCTCKATSLSKMARLVCSYSDDAVAIIENVYKFCIEEKKSRLKLSRNRVWDRTAGLTGVSRSTANCGREEECTGNHRHLRRMCLDNFDQGVVLRTIASMYFLKKVLPTLRTELKQSIGYTGSKGRLRKDLLHAKFSYTRCEVNKKSADGETKCSPQQDQIPSHGMGIERGRLHSRLYRLNLR